MTILSNFSKHAMLALLLIAIVSLAGCLKPSDATATPTPIISPNATAQVAGLKSFESWEDLSSFLEETQSPSGYYRGGFEALDLVGAIGAPMMATAAKSEAGAQAPSASTDYSTTNIQVLGVDEPDIVKNDGKYIYAVTEGNVVIMDAFPPAGAKVVSVLEEPKGSFQSVFINGDKLIAFGSREHRWPVIEKAQADANAGGSGETGVSNSKIAAEMQYYPYYGEQSSFIKVYDVSNREKPKLVKTIVKRGNFVQARMIENKVYAIFSEYPYGGIPRPMPLLEVDGEAREIAPSEISYFDYPSYGYQYTAVLGFDLNDLAKRETKKIVLMGSGQNIFVSRENAYITYTQQGRNYYYDDWRPYERTIMPLMPQEEIAKIQAVDNTNVSEWRKNKQKIKIASSYVQSAPFTEQLRLEILSAVYSEFDKAATPETATAIVPKRVSEETTAIHKISLGEKIQYEAFGEVPGHVLNQFSMDEYNGFFRIATTLGTTWFRPGGGSYGTSANNVYVLDAGLEQVGALEDLAPGESIYSARFMGDKAYLVTFKKVDPLFVIGLADPENPKMLGKLKIPGYSDYLHPYDENHLIGLGKDAVPAKDGDFAWYQGVKLSLFDVSDVSNPREISSFKIGDRGTESYALDEHKAFLFSKSKGLLVIPILLAEIDEEKYPYGAEPQAYGEYKFQGAYAFNLTLQDGFKLKGTVSHAPQSAFKENYYGGWGDTDVQRSLYMDGYLYTVSQKAVKINDLNTMKELAAIALQKPPAPNFDAETYCEEDADCACGVHWQTGNCFVGNQNYVDTETQCPDYCTGIAGNLETTCVQNKCTTTQAK